MDHERGAKERITRVHELAREQQRVMTLHLHAQQCNPLITFTKLVTQNLMLQRPIASGPCNYLANTSLALSRSHCFSVSGVSRTDTGMEDGSSDSTVASLLPLPPISSTTLRAS